MQAAITIDPEFQALIAPLQPIELAELEASLKSEGCREPLAIWQGLLIDGHNRYQICQRAGIEFKTRNVDFADREYVKLWIETNQLGRRNLTDDQRTAIWDSIRERRSDLAKRERAAKGGKTSTNSYSTDPKTVKEKHLSDNVSDKSEPKADTRAAVAKEAKLPERKLRDFAALKKKAPAAAKRVRDGKTTIKEEKRALKEGDRKKRRSQAATTGQAAPVATSLYALHCGDISSGMDELDASSVNVIITDAPYPAEYLPLYEVLAEKSKRVLKSGGLCVVMCGQSYLPDIYAMMSRHLTYHWTAAYLTPGGQAVQQFPRKVNTFWKPLLVYSNGPYDGKWFGDVTKSAVNDNDKEHHDWGQSVSGMLDVVSHFSEEGDVVLDPFVGAGTTGVACLKLKRRFIGIDKDEENIAISRGRLVNA